MTDRASRFAGVGFGTVRVRVTLLATVLVALTLLGASIGLVSVQGRLLARGIEEALQQRVDNIAPTIGPDVSNLTLPVEGDRQDSFVQLLDPHGRVVAASNNAKSFPAVARPLGPRANDRFSVATHLPSAAHTYRVLAHAIGSGRHGLTLVVAKNLDDVNESIHILKSSLARFVPFVVVLLAFLVWWLTGRVLRPVEAIRAEVAIIEGTKLNRRVPVPPRDDEIARLARTMNAMLDRIEDSSIRQQSFIADASHELRSPLARIRTHLEVCLAYPAVDEPSATYESLLADATELQTLIDDLLLAARSDASAMASASVVIDLDDLVVANAHRLRERSRVRVDTSAVSAARVAGDRGQLARVIRNLADNAERHAATKVAFAVREFGDNSVLVVSDDGLGIPAAQRSVVFDRFTRLDEARSRDEGGSGLGLAIAHEIVTRHGGTIEITSTEGQGARFVVTLPRAD